MEKNFDELPDLAMQESLLEAWLTVNDFFNDDTAAVVTQDTKALMAAVLAAAHIISHP